MLHSRERVKFDGTFFFLAAGSVFQNGLPRDIKLASPVLQKLLNADHFQGHFHLDPSWFCYNLVWFNLTLVYVSHLYLYTLTLIIYCFFVCVLHCFPWRSLSKTINTNTINWLDLVIIILGDLGGKRWKPYYFGGPREAIKLNSEIGLWDKRHLLWLILGSRITEKGLLQH